MEWESIMNPYNLEGLEQKEPRKLKDMSLQEYKALEETGMMYEWYPEATGIFWQDCMEVEEPEHDVLWPYGAAVSEAVNSHDHYLRISGEELEDLKKARDRLNTIIDSMEEVQ